MFDLTRSYWEDAREYNLAPAATVEEEGQFLVFVPDGTSVAVQPSAGAAAERPAGWAITDAKKVTTWVVVENVTVPAGGGVVQLQNSNLVPGSELVYDETAGAALAPAVAPPGAGEYTLSTVNGTVQFNAAEAGNSVRVVYRYNLTLQEIFNRFNERSINNRAQDYFGRQSVAKGEGEFYTTMFDTSEEYAVGDNVLTGAGGLVTSAAGGVVVGHVIRVPDAEYPYLGVKFQIPT